MSEVMLAKLAEYEKKIAVNWQEMAQSLIAIREEKLYKLEYATFDEYCQERWGYRKSRVNQLITAERVIQKLQTDTRVEVLPANEAQTRPLSGLPESKQAEAWARAVETAPRNDAGEPQLTRSHVAAVVEDYDPKKHNRPTRTPPTQEEIDLRDFRSAIKMLQRLPGDAAYYLDKYGQAAVGEDILYGCGYFDPAAKNLSAPDGTGIMLNDKSTWYPTEEDLREWGRAFPNIDINAELIKCASWNRSNPARRKSRRGVMRHVNSWLERAEEKLQKSGAEHPSQEHINHHQEL